MATTVARRHAVELVMLLVLLPSTWVAVSGPAAAAPACTEVIGFSQTHQWYEEGGFESLVDARAWQLRWQGGAFVTKWADPDYEGWQDDRLFHACPQGPPDRVVLTISAPGQDVEEIADQIRTALPTISDRHPGADVVLQPLVGGPDGETCTVNGEEVRASRTAPLIAEAVIEVAADDARYVVGPSPTVASCDQYRDSIGHLTEAGAAHVARLLADHYDDGGGGGTEDVALARWSGETRYETAVAVARAIFGSPTAMAHVASGEDFPDALAAGVVGALTGSPVLLTRSDRLPGTTADELRRLATSEVVVAGGPDAVTDDVVAAIEGIIDADVRRRAGTDRYATAVAMARSGTTEPPDVVLVASGEQFPDALASSPLAAARGARLVLTRPDELPSVTRSVLDGWSPEEIIVLGGPDAVSDAVATELESLAGRVTRLAGADRYATAVAISQALVPEGGVARVVLTTGQGFADALAAGPAAHVLGAPILLVSAVELPPVVADELARLAPSEIVVIGGTAAIAAGVADAAVAAARRAS